MDRSRFDPVWVLVLLVLLIFLFGIDVVDWKG
jgi:hypothetical protein